jgi:hypothetical protein
LEREIARSGLKDASQYLDAAIGAGAPERDVFIYCAAALRVIQDVQKETPAMRSMRLPSQGGAAAAGELDASYDLWNRINAYCIAHKPASIAVVSRVLVAVEAVAVDLCGTTGNIGRLSVGAFESQFLNPEKQKQQGEIVKLQLRRGWLASYLGPKGPAGRLQPRRRPDRRGRAVSLRRRCRVSRAVDELDSVVHSIAHRMLERASRRKGIEVLAAHVAAMTPDQQEALARDHGALTSFVSTWFRDAASTYGLVLRVTDDEKTENKKSLADAQDAAARGEWPL